MSARLPIRLLGRAELAAEPSKLGLAVQRQARPTGVLGLDETLPGSLGLFERLFPGAVELQDLCSVHEATAGEGDDVGLALAPAGEGGCPLPGPAELEDLLAGQDHPAIDDPRHDR